MSNWNNNLQHLHPSDPHDRNIIEDLQHNLKTEPYLGLRRQVGAQKEAEMMKRLRKKSIQSVRVLNRAKVCELLRILEKYADEEDCQRCFSLKTAAQHRMVELSSKL